MQQADPAVFEDIVMEKKMNGHHLILGEQIDFITGETISDTHDERYRQKLARLLVNDKGFDKNDILPRFELLTQANDRRAIVPIDFLVSLAGKICMLIKYGPGSVVTRHRSALAASRLVVSYQIPIAVVTNGEDADILDGLNGKVIRRGLDAVHNKKELLQIKANFDFKTIPPQRAEMESRIFYCFEVDGSCECDDTICRLP